MSSELEVFHGNKMEIRNISGLHLIQKYHYISKMEFFLWNDGNPKAKACLKVTWKWNNLCIKFMRFLKRLLYSKKRIKENFLTFNTSAGLTNDYKSNNKTQKLCNSITL